MNRAEFETSLAPSLACLGALYARIQPLVAMFSPDDEMNLNLTAAEMLEVSLSLHTAIQALAALQLMVEQEKARR